MPQLKLSDMYSPIICYLMEQLNTQEIYQAEYGLIKNIFSSKLKEVEEENTESVDPLTNESQFSYKKEVLDKAKFAVVSLIDEKLMQTNWPGSLEWRKSPLQKEIFNTMRAGNVFYENLKSIPDSEHETDRDLREVYYYVLIFGFEGIHYNTLDKKKEILLEQKKIITRFDNLNFNIEKTYPTGEYKNAIKSNFILINRKILLFIFIFSSLALTSAIFYFHKKGIIDYSLEIGKIF